MAETVTNRGKYLALSRLLSGGAALDLRMLVFTGTAVGTDDPDLNTVADLDAVSGVSIHADRQTLTGEAAAENDSANRGELDANDVTFAAAPGVTAQGVAIYDEGSGTDATRQIIATYSTGFPQPMDGGLVVVVSDFLRAT